MDSHLKLQLLFAIPVLLLTAWFYTAAMAQSRFPTLRNKAIVLLIAHPDDEAMFFAPTILGLLKPELGNHLKILCLSSGDAENIGHIRKKELLISGKILGLRSESDIFIYEDPAFADSMSATWDSSKIAEVLNTFFTAPPVRATRKKVGESEEAPEATIDALITFDRHGISGHPNHKSLYRGALVWLKDMMRNKSGWECPVSLYTLTTTGVARKYLSVLDGPYTLLSCVLLSLRSSSTRKEKGAPARIMFFSGIMEFAKARQAMTTAHKSQMRWFRWGWITIGRYMVVNDLKREKIV